MAMLFPSVALHLLLVHGHDCTEEVSVMDGVCPQPPHTCSLRNLHFAEAPVWASLQCLSSQPGIEKGSLPGS